MRDRARHEPGAKDAIGTCVSDGPVEPWNFFKCETVDLLQEPNSVCEGSRVAPDFNFSSRTVNNDLDTSQASVGDLAVEELPDIHGSSLEVRSTDKG